MTTVKIVDGFIVDEATGKKIGKATKAKVIREVNVNTCSIFFVYEKADGSDVTGWLNETGKQVPRKFPSVLAATAYAQSAAKIVKEKLGKPTFFEIVVGNPQDGVPAVSASADDGTIEVVPAKAETLDVDGVTVIEPAQPEQVVLKWAVSGTQKKSLARKMLAAEFAKVGL